MMEMFEIVKHTSLLHESLNYTLKSVMHIAQESESSAGYTKQGILAEGKSSIQLTSSLSWLALFKSSKKFY